VIIVVWAEDMHNLYRAKDVATALGYNYNGQDPRRRLQYYRNEYLVWGGISADDYRILAVFPGDALEDPSCCALPIEASRPSCWAILRTIRLHEMCQKSSSSKYIATLGLKMNTGTTVS
jgi:hypothetical protein